MGLTLLEVASAWSRVEAGAHFPSDVLAGAGMGNFWGSFVDEAYLHEDPQP